MLCLQVRLIKAREPHVAMVRFKFSVDIFLAIFWILVVLETFAVCNVCALKLYHDCVVSDFLVLSRDVDLVVLENIGRVRANIHSIDVN